MRYVTAAIARKELQISYMTLKRWKDENKIKTKVLSQRKILYDIDSILKNSDDNRMNVVYARVSTTNQKNDLNHQIELIKNYMISNGIRPDEVYSDIGSGLNEDRLGLQKLINDIQEDKVKTVYISFKDRLTRFGFNYFKNIFSTKNVDIVVLDENEMTNKSFELELVEDLISIIHHYSTKLYSNRRKKMKEIENILKNEDLQN